MQTDKAGSPPQNTSPVKQKPTKQLIPVESDEPCGICFTTNKLLYYFRLNGCNQVICSNCLREYIKKQIKSEECCFIKSPLGGYTTKLTRYELFSPKLFPLDSIRNSLFKEYNTKIDKHKSFTQKGLKCPKCCKNVCPDCGYFKHDGYTCEQNKIYQQRKRFIKKLEKQGTEFVKESFAKSSYNYSHIRLNTNLLKDCDAWKRFEASIKEDEKLQQEKQKWKFKAEEFGLFLYHGTSKESIEKIRATGFDPSRRSGQAYGRGEYFSRKPDISKGYCSNNSNQMILNYILKKESEIKMVSEGDIVVVDNPIGWENSYCLPLLVITLKK
ncbi:RBR-type E3 ubiquitin transferase [Entamoeba marina]